MSRETPSVQSVERAVSLLRAIAQAAGTSRRLTVAEAATAAGLNRATAWRLLGTLEREGLVSVDQSGRYGIGYAAVEIAAAADLTALVRSARRVLTDLSLQTGETASLAMTGPGAPKYVEEVAPASVVSARWTGRQVSWHGTSTGKAVLAFADPSLAERVLAGPLERHTDTTIVDRDQLAQELADVRAVGYAVCRGEYDDNAWGVSAPVLDSHQKPIAVISIWGPASRITEERFAALGPMAHQAAVGLRPH
jgi:DNA-binding IclR family transcriptional regulator